MDSATAKTAHLISHSIRLASLDVIGIARNRPIQVDDQPTTNEHNNNIILRQHDGAILVRISLAAHGCHHPIFIFMGCNETLSVVSARNLINFIPAACHA
jgi:hypothetical protein